MRHIRTRRKTTPGLAIIDAPMRQAIAEFNGQERAAFLKRYGFSRSSKFYLIYGHRLYDTKALVSAAYRHAAGKRLPNTAFSGGAQTKAVFHRWRWEMLSCGFSTFAG